MPILHHPSIALRGTAEFVAQQAARVAALKAIVPASSEVPYYLQSNVEVCEGKRRKKSEDCLSGSGCVGNQDAASDHAEWALVLASAGEGKEKEAGEEAGEEGENAPDDSGSETRAERSEAEEESAGEESGGESAYEESVEENVSEGDDEETGEGESEGEEEQEGEEEGEESDDEESKDEESEGEYEEDI